MQFTLKHDQTPVLIRTLPKKHFREYPADFLYPCVGRSIANRAFPDRLSFSDRRIYPAFFMVDKAPQERLSVISKHLESRPQIPITTPYSVGGNSSRHPQIRISSSNLQSLEKSKMSNQPEHPALLIPGPIEFDDAVLQSMSHFRYVLEPLGL